MSKPVLILYFTLFLSIPCLLSQAGYYSSNSNINQQASGIFKDFLEKELKSESNKYGIIVVEPVIKTISSKRIEGIVTKNLNKTELRIRVFNRITKQDTSIKFSYNIHDGNSKNNEIRTIEEFLKHDNHKSKVVVIISGFINSSQLFCHEYDKILNEFFNSDNLHSAIETIAFLNLNKMCQSETVLRDKILDKYRNELCEKQLYDARVLIATGTPINLKKAADLLLSIPPGSKFCKTESLEVIKQLSDKTDLNMNSKQQLGHYTNQLKNNDMNSWFMTIIDKAYNY